MRIEKSNHNEEMIMSLFTRKKFEAIKMHIRKLLTKNNDQKNPYDEAYDFLIQFFDNIIIYYYGHMSFNSPQKTPKKTQNKYNILQKKLNTLTNIHHSIKNIPDDLLKLENSIEINLNKLTQRPYQILFEKEKNPEHLNFKTISIELSEIFANGIFESLNTSHEKNKKEELPLKNDSFLDILEEIDTNTPIKNKHSTCQKENNPPNTQVRQKKIKEAAKQHDFHELIVQSIEHIIAFEKKILTSKVTLQESISHDIDMHKSAINKAILLLKKKNKKHKNNYAVIRSVFSYFRHYIFSKFANLENTNPASIHEILKVCQQKQNDLRYKEIEQDIIDFFTPEKCHPTMGLYNPYYFLESNLQHSTDELLHEYTELQTALQTTYQHKISTDLKNKQPTLLGYLSNYKESKDSTFKTFLEFFKKSFKRRTKNEQDSQRSRINDTDNLITHILPKMLQLNETSTINDILFILINLNRAIYDDSSARINNQHLISQHITARKNVLNHSKYKKKVLRNLRIITHTLDNNSHLLNCLCSNSTQKKNLYFEMNHFLNQDIAETFKRKYCDKLNGVFGRISAAVRFQSKGRTERERIVKKLLNNLITCRSKKDYLNLLYQIAENIQKLSSANILSHYHDDVLMDALQSMMNEIIFCHILNPIKKNEFQLDFNLAELETVQYLLGLAAKEKSAELDTFKVFDTLDTLVQEKKNQQLLSNDPDVQNSFVFPESSSNNQDDSSNMVDEFKTTLKTLMKYERNADGMKMMGYFTLNPTELGYIFQVVSLLAEHVPLVSTISPGIAPAGKFLDATLQENNSKNMVDIMNSYGGDRCYKIFVNEAIDKLGKIFENEINKMSDKKHAHRLAKICFNRMKNAFKINDPRLYKLGIVEQLIASVFLRSDSLNKIFPERFRKLGNKDYFTDTYFDELIETVGFKFSKIENSSTTIQTKLATPQARQPNVFDNNKTIEAPIDNDTTNNSLNENHSNFNLYLVNSVPNSITQKYCVSDDPPISIDLVQIIGRTLQA